MERSVKETNIEKHNFLGLSVSSFDKDQLISYIKQSVINNQNKILYGYGLGFFMRKRQHPGMYDWAEQSDVLVTDGIPFYKLAKFHGLPLKYNISIPQMVILVLELSNQNQWSVFLLGATKEINQQAQKRIKDNYPYIRLVYGEHGYFDKKDEQQIVDRINKLEINILLIGISSPKKEEFAANWKEHLRTNIIIPCGGMIDVLSGKTKLTPNWIKRSGMAWLYRLIQEPRRLIKIHIVFFIFFFCNFIPKYIWHVVIMRNRNYSFYETQD